MPPATSPKSNRFRFSLRNLMLFVAAIALVLGLYVQLVEGQNRREWNRRMNMTNDLKDRRGTKHIWPVEYQPPIAPGMRFVEVQKALRQDGFSFDDELTYPTIEVSRRTPGGWQEVSMVFNYDRTLRKFECKEFQRVDQ